MGYGWCLPVVVVGIGRRFWVRSKQCEWVQNEQGREADVISGL